MAEIGIFVGTMYGNSLLVAEEAEAILTAQGHKATVFEDPELSDWLPYQDKYVLVVTSTTGEDLQGQGQGGSPDHLDCGRAVHSGLRVHGDSVTLIDNGLAFKD